MYLKILCLLSQSACAAKGNMNTKIHFEIYLHLIYFLILIELLILVFVM